MSGEDIESNPTQAESRAMLSRFKGALVGAVVADCIGACFEGMPTVKLSEVIKVYTKLETWRQAQREKGTRPADVYGFSFTDDTAMARSIMYSLLEKQALDPVDLAKRFSQEYYKEPRRGYGGNVVSVFEALRQSEDVFEPAKQQFDGRGSYGNGGSMRIAPASLFLYHKNSPSELQELTTDVTRLTHTHPHAVNGAILQAFAVDLSLRLSQGDTLDIDWFCDELIKRMKPIEEASYEKISASPPPTKKVPPKRELDAQPCPYCAKLEKVKEFVKTEDLSPATVEKVLGNDVSALGSVPAAVLSFLRGVDKGVKNLEEENPFKRVVTYAFTLGGDTDTIGTMAAAMAGAYFGQEKIPEEWQYYCEGVADADTAAEMLYHLGHPDVNISKPQEDALSSTN